MNKVAYFSICLTTFLFLRVWLQQVWPAGFTITMMRISSIKFFFFIIDNVNAAWNVFEHHNFCILSLAWQVQSVCFKRKNITMSESTGLLAVLTLVLNKHRPAAPLAAASRTIVDGLFMNNNPDCGFINLLVKNILNLLLSCILSLWPCDGRLVVWRRQDVRTWKYITSISRKSYLHSRYLNSKPVWSPTAYRYWEKLLLLVFYNFYPQVDLNICELLLLLQ